jgi:uncharacterized Zn finger protein
MSKEDVETLKAAIQKSWIRSPGEKAGRYVGQFYDTIRIGRKITARVKGNHGIYTVTVQATDQGLSSACSCYIGRGGGCHHCVALAITFLNDPEAFREIKTRRLDEVEKVQELGEYLQGITLESLLKELGARGITQKALAQGMGMNPRHLSSIRSSELRNRYFNELGATKLACLWVLERFGKAADE